MFEFGSAGAGLWIWPLLAAAIALWLLAFWVIWQSQKFRRKMQWLFLACVAFPFVHVQTSTNASITFGIPLGAIYVLWFWRVGPAPPGKPRNSRDYPKDLGGFLGSQAGFVATLAGAFMLYALSLAAGGASGLLLLASSIIACKAMQVRGEALARPKAAVVSSVSWCVSALLLAVMVTFGSGQSDLVLNLLGGGAVVALWPAFVCMPPLLKNSWLSG